MDWLKRFLSAIRMEPALFFYMCSASLKYPVFQSLLYEKACASRYGERFDCTNIDEIYDDKNLQSDANRLYLISSLCLILPSIFSALLLGSLSDSWNAKITMIIPFIGLIAGDVNYLFQTLNVKNSPYYLLISDVLFGICGGYTAIIGTLLSYNVKSTPSDLRSERVAAFEGAIGLGSTMGYALSGIVNEYVGYSYYFLILMVLDTICYFYIVIFAKELESQNGILSSQSIFSRFIEVFHFLISYRNNPYFKIFSFILIALSFEMLVYAGITDIMYSYLRYKLSWNDKPYGWFSGLGSGFNSMAVLFLYPLLHRHGSNDVMLSIYGIITKIIFLFMFAFLFSNWWAYLSLIPITFNRFVSTGLRASSSHFVDYAEQGKLFSLIALIEGITSIIATLAFNGLYPLTLSFFAGTVFVVVAVSLLLPLGLLVNVHKNLKEIQPETNALNPSAISSNNL
uniref:Proton-coupled folate transporter n=1 Tax=Panagrolaimus sp. PS1159 TaxID=55785 RepID=A0AC35FUI4_9BILA